MAVVDVIAVVGVVHHVHRQLGSDLAAAGTPGCQRAVPDYPDFGPRVRGTSRNRMSNREREKAPPADVEGDIAVAQSLDHVVPESLALPQALSDECLNLRDCHGLNLPCR